jgi:serine phosphatase RsbU (regulator of sigma subunit)
LQATIAQRKNHDTFPIEIQSREVKYGQEVVTVISIRDITIRKRTEKELEEANKIARLAAELEKKNKDVMSSIEYARRIQQAILPSEGAIGKGFVENFVLYLPRDIVSGDFYWFAEKNEHSLIAAVDCTGHGVPGAFMSIIGHSNLNKIVVEQGYTEPDAILRKLDREITNALKQQEGDSESRDGMDVALCSLNIFEGILSFAGAQRAMYVIRQGEIIEFKGDSFSMGGNFKSKKKQKEFTKHEIALEKDDTIYIFSDGYPDQFGGLDNRKFTSKQFKELLVRIQTYSLEEQKNILKREFDIWKGAYKQMDDVMVIGLKF